MAGDGIIYLLWGDLTGLARCRGLPLADLEARAEAGLGWACAGHALTPFEAIVPNVWGPMDEARQIPDLATRFTIPEQGDHPAIDGVICDSRSDVDQDWDCCARTFLKRALSDFRAETGLELIATFEHEFLLAGEFKQRTPFSFAAVREVQPVLLAIEEALRAAGAPVETIEPEYGLGQYEISSPPLWAMAAADKALVTREVVREVARRHGLEASFTPKPSPDAVGSGCHVHFSFRDGDGLNVAHDSGRALGPERSRGALLRRHPRPCRRAGRRHGTHAGVLLSPRAASLVLRLSGDRGAEPRGGAAGMPWNCQRSGAAPALVQHRVPPDRRRRIALPGAGHAGAGGARRHPPGLPLPEPVGKDPSELTPEEARAAGVTPLPTSLGAALDALEADEAARSWMSPNLLATFVEIKRWEARYAEMVSADELFRRYRETY